MNRCAARGCGRWTRAGAAFCARHEMDGDPADEAVMTRGAGGLAAFRARLEAGDFDAVLGHGLKETLRSAAEQAGLDAEVGALRLALVRLLEEERDPSRLAAGIAKVAGVSVQAARLRHSADADADDLRTFLERGVAKLDAERAQAEVAAKGGEPDDRDGRGDSL